MMDSKNADVVISVSREHWNESVDAINAILAQFHNHTNENDGSASKSGISAKTILENAVKIKANIFDTYQASLNSQSDDDITTKVTNLTTDELNTMLNEIKQENENEIKVHIHWFLCKDKQNTKQKLNLFCLYTICLCFFISLSHWRVSKQKKPKKQKGKQHN